MTLLRRRASHRGVPTWEKSDSLRSLILLSSLFGPGVGAVSYWVVRPSYTPTSSWSRWNAAYAVTKWRMVKLVRPKGFYPCAEVVVSCEAKKDQALGGSRLSIRLSPYT